ncbi:ferritin family protein [Lysinibacillus sphaericus]
MFFNPQWTADTRTAADTRLIKDIQKAINAEYSAIACYEKLARNAPTQQEKDRILEIQKDEKRHLKEFSSIYAVMTGSKPSYKITETCPDNYKAGIEFAFNDEQGAVDTYLDIADKAQDPAIRDRFRRAASDEQNHAVWFLSFIQKNARNSRFRRQNIDFGAKGALNAASLTLPQMLTYAIQDEYLAQARYNNIIGNFGNIRTFVQIKEAELRHISALLPLFQRYQVPVPPDTSQSLVTTPGNIKGAYAAGVQGEIDNIAMYDRFLSMNIPDDVRTVFTQVRNASVNHLAAFERGLARR